MKTGGKIVLGFIGFLLTLSIIVAQTLFQIERTLLSYTFMSDQLERVAAPLKDPGIHEEAAAGLLVYVQDQLPRGYSQQLAPYIREAAIRGFDIDWFLRTGKRLVFNSQRFLKGEEGTLSLPVSFDSFKIALLDIAGAELEAGEYLEIDRELSQIDSSIDLGTLVPEQAQQRITRGVKNRRLVFITLIYIVPAILALLCFVPRELGRGLTVFGSSLLAGGGSMAVFSLILPNLVFRASSSAIEKALPDFLGWAADGAGGFAGKIISGFLPVGAAIGGFGLVAAVCGIYLSRKEGNLRAKKPKDH